MFPSVAGVAVCPAQWKPTSLDSGWMLIDRGADVWGICCFVRMGSIRTDLRACVPAWRGEVMAMLGVDLGRS